MLAVHKRLIGRFQRRTYHVGIIKECASRVWERRTPLVPAHVSHLVSKGVSVSIEKCNRRVFTDAAYDSAGASVVDSVSHADLILGVKEVQPEFLWRDKTYMYFTHTHKAQPHNMPLLRHMLASGSTFLDFELLTDATGARTTAFGQMAGFSGTIEGLSNLSTQLLQMGYATPLLHVPRPYMMGSVDHAKAILRATGNAIAKRGTPSDLGPIIVAVAGQGRVSAGARSALDALGVEWKEAASLPESAGWSLDKVYAVQLQLSDYILPRGSSLPGCSAQTETSSACSGQTRHPPTFDKQDYYAHPHKYKSTFATAVAPFVTLFVNGAYWSEAYPRIMTSTDLSGLRATAAPTRFLSVVDVSCDLGGALEFVTQATTIDAPVYTEQGTHISSIDILPTEFPQESSEGFSTAILPYVSQLCGITADAAVAHALERATIASRGVLAPPHAHLGARLGSASSPARPRPLHPTPAPHASPSGLRHIHTPSVSSAPQILILGSGFVAGPAVRTLLAHDSACRVRLASNDMPGMHALQQIDSARIDTSALDLADVRGLAALVADADAVLSLLPAPLHPQIAQACIASRTPLVTASYKSEEMQALHLAAVDAGVTVLTELGLDPGIDHCIAMEMIDAGRARTDLALTDYVSFCGGLPAPECPAVTPMQYKFSWSPRGVLTAAKNDARFRIAGEDVYVPSEDLLTHKFPRIKSVLGRALEGIPNRDSLKYLAQYGLASDLPTILRGTLRYEGFVDIMRVLRLMGLLDDSPVPAGLESFSDVANHLSGSTLSSKEWAALAQDTALARAVEATLQVLDSASIFPLKDSAHSALDLLSLAMQETMAYDTHERDAVYLYHDLTYRGDDGHMEVHSSALIEYGEPGGDSAMAKTVGVPAALGVIGIVTGQIKTRGVVTPMDDSIWKSIMAQLRKLEWNVVSSVHRVEG